MALPKVSLPGDVITRWSKGMYMVGVVVEEEEDVVVVVGVVVAMTLLCDDE
jgi:hypothetical protein